jgi:hypothetical protein
MTASGVAPVTNDRNRKISECQTIPQSHLTLFGQQPQNPQCRYAAKSRENQQPLAA